MGAAAACSHHHADKTDAQWRQRHIGPVIGLPRIEPLRVVDRRLKIIGIQGPDFRLMRKADVGDVHSEIRNYESNVRTILRSNAYNPVPCRTH